MADDLVSALRAIEVAAVVAASRFRRVNLGSCTLDTIHHKLGPMVTFRPPVTSLKSDIVSKRFPLNGASQTQILI